MKSKIALCFFKNKNNKNNEQTATSLLFRNNNFERINKILGVYSSESYLKSRTFAYLIIWSLNGFIAMVAYGTQTTDIFLSKDKILFCKMIKER